MNDNFVLLNSQSNLIYAYHNIKTDETVVPNFNQGKVVLQDYLSKHNIPFQPLETEKQLYEKNQI